MSELKTHIETLAKKAAEADKSEDAMRLSQAACNVANAFAVLDNIENRSK